MILLKMFYNIYNIEYRIYFKTCIDLTNVKLNFAIIYTEIFFMIRSW